MYDHQWGLCRGCELRSGGFHCKRGHYNESRLHLVVDYFSQCPETQHYTTCPMVIEALKYSPHDLESKKQSLADSYSSHM